MKLFAKWNSKDSRTAEKAVREIDDQKKLARIAVEARSSEAREAAVEKLKAEDHQPLLAEIAKTDGHWRVCRAAIEKLIAEENQPQLVDIVKADYGNYVSEAAISMLTDQACIADVASNAINWIARIAAIEKLIAEEHQPLLIEIAKTDKVGDVRVAAIEKLIAEEHQTLLAEIAKTDEDCDVRIAAISKLTDKELLRQVIAHHGDVLKGSDEDKRRQSEQVLLHIYEQHHDYEIRKQIAAYNGTLIEAYRPQEGYESSDHDRNTSYVITQHERDERRFRVPVPPEEYES
ncbi:MAG: hypothetical protein LBD21_04730 [Tannerellaceae bacterium]|jgi:uncharacterized Fe-S cluster-containing radical SAM superfamily protein|nr:hypothetical protein [Tannerellaceae bacterium]